ncbi:hypothetical protein H311_04486, partial [Anncaliia algerae PRA109]
GKKMTEGKLLEEILKKDLQEDECFASENLKDIKITNLEDEYLLSNKHKTLKDKLLEKLIPQSYTKIDCKMPLLNSLHEETLFYIFYMYPKDKVQENAFYSLLDMGYKYCTVLKNFIYFSDEVVVDNKKRKVVLFDPFLWEKVTKDVTFDKDFISSLIYKNTRFVKRYN